MSEAANSQAEAGKPEKRKGKRLVLILWFLAATPFLLILWPTFLLGAFMLPTLIAAMTEWRKRKHMTASVGFLNAVGVLPPVVRLWETGQDSAFAVELLGDFFNWSVALVAAGCGYLVFLSAEWVVAAYYRWTATERLRRIAANQEKLIELWGPEVVSPAAAELMSDAAPSESEGEQRASGE